MQYYWMVLDMKSMSLYWYKEMNEERKNRVVFFLLVDYNLIHTEELDENRKITFW